MEVEAHSEERKLLNFSVKNSFLVGNELTIHHHLAQKRWISFLSNALSILCTVHTQFKGTVSRDEYFLKV
jgi:hypothetical protein